MTTVFTTSGGVDISYSDTGRSDGPVLVLLHGLGEGGVSWRPLLPALEAEHRVLNVTLRGHTPSQWPGEYSFATFFSDVTELLDALSLSRVTLLGHSLGGLVAFMIAVDRPDLVSRLIAEDVAPGPPFPPRPKPVRPEGELSFDWEMLLALRPQVLAGALPLRDRLPTLAAPTLLIGGGESSHIPQAWLAEAAALLPQAELITLGGGHNVHETRPQEFTAVVLGWLERHPVQLF